jgi:hypothetical protein
MMKLGVAIAISLCACGGGSKRTTYYAVGAKDYNASPVSCSIVDNAGGALVAVADHYKAKDGKGVVFEAVKPGKARIECADGNNGMTVEVREAARLELRRNDGAKTPFPVGAYAPTFCLKAFDTGGTELELGTIVDGATFEWSEHVSRVVDHGMGGAGSASCVPQGMGHKEGSGTVSGTWHGLSAKGEFEVKGTQP